MTLPTTDRIGSIRISTKRLKILAASAENIAKSMRKFAKILGAFQPVIHQKTLIVHNEDLWEEFFKNVEDSPVQVRAVEFMSIITEPSTPTPKRQKDWKQNRRFIGKHEL